MTAVQAKSRGGVASSECVALYRALYEAERPLTLDEVAGSSLLSIYKTPAYGEYRDFREKQLKPFKLASEWSPEERRVAWFWWLGKILKASLDTNRIVAKTPDGTAANGKRRNQLIYTANHDNPPKVYEKVMCDVRVDWRPGIGELGARHVAGVQFLQQADALLQGKLSAEVKGALNLAVKAIREEHQG